MRSIFTDSSKAVQNSFGMVATLAANPRLSKVEAKDKSFKGSVERNQAGEITKATATSTGWLTETEVEFS